VTTSPADLLAKPMKPLEQIERRIK
jgi:hypothetical protein